jgi:phosphopantothenoylcysteine decarboxylase
MANVLLGVTGSVAAIKTPELFGELRRRGHAVKVVATQPALYFFDPASLDGSARRNPEVMILDEDEWPGQADGKRWQRGEPVLHIELRRWADLLLIAPLDANTLAKLAGGLCDNCLTCVWRAWELSRPLVLAPAMNTLMWDHPVTARHFRQLAQDVGVRPPAELDLIDLLEWINHSAAALAVVPPETKRLACNDEGMGAMAGLESIANLVEARLRR